MMSGKDCSGQVVEETVTHFAVVALSFGLCFVMSIFDYLGGVAVGTFNTFRPAKVTNHLVTLGIVDQSMNVYSHRAENSA
jgi:hypothetical protein